MISLSCAWVLKAFTQNPCTGLNKYSHSLKTHANPMCNQQNKTNVLKPTQGGISDSQNDHANRLKPMHRLTKTKKTAYAESGTRRRTTSQSQPQRQGGTHTHALARLRLARSHATQRTTNETTSRLGDSQVHTPPKPPTYIYIYICM